MKVKYPRLVLHQQHALAVLRIYLGLVFLFMASSKLDAHYVASFPRLLQGMAKGHPIGFYGDLLRSLMVPYAWFFAYVLLLGEILVGVGLLLGLFTAPAGLFGALIQLNYLLAFAKLGVYTTGLHLTLAVVLVALAYAYAGTTWGLDRKLIDRTPHWLQGLRDYEYREF
jgi:thiosulfate dehydrogenase [quinone] large subunit